MDDQLIRTLYQVAGDERLWEPALNDLAGRFRSAAASVLVYQGLEAVRARATARLREVAHAFLEQRMWETDGRMRHFLQAPIERFVVTDQHFPPEVLEQNQVIRLMAGMGLRHQAGSAIRVADGDHIAVFMLDRTAGQGPFSPHELLRLDRLRGHLAGAAKLAHYLTRQRVQQAAAVLQAIGQPAAVLDERGAVAACNALFEADFPAWAVQGARGRFRLRDRRAQPLLAAALACLNQDEPAPPVCVRAAHGVQRQLQLRPLLGPTRECLMGGHALLLADTPSAPPLTAQARLRRRHGLTEREAELACLLAAGASLRQCADALCLTYNTTRTYLARIHVKTGTRRQAELVRRVLDALN